jgi:putative lipoprotein
VNNGSGGVTSVPAGVTGAVSFLEDGTIQGFGGCNNFSGTYTLDGDSIVVGPLMATRMACADEAASTFEAQFLSALQISTAWSVAGSTLELRADDGSLQVEAASAIGR